jgi:hypothetical protein
MNIERLNRAIDDVEEIENDLFYADMADKYRNYGDQIELACELRLALERTLASMPAPPTLRIVGR